MIKKIGLCILVMLITSGINAQTQKKLTYSVGVELGYVFDHANNILASNLVAWDRGVGVSAQVEYFFKKKLSADFLVGYISYKERSSLEGFLVYPAFKVIPIRIGARYYPLKNLHIGIQAGIGTLTGGANNIHQEGTSFSYSPQIGYKFKILKTKAIDIELKYDVYTYSDYHFNAAGLRLAFVF